jgi:hypothetical protein
MFSLKATFDKVSRFFSPTEEDRLKKVRAKLDERFIGEYYHWARMYYGSNDTLSPIFDHNLFLSGSGAYNNFAGYRCLPGSILFIEGAADNIVVGNDKIAYLVIGSQYWDGDDKCRPTGLILRPLSPKGVEELSPDVSERLKILASLDTMLSALNAKSSEAKLSGEFLSHGLFSGAAGSIKGKFESLSGMKTAFVNWSESFVSNVDNEIIVPVVSLKTTGPIQIAALAKSELKRLEAAIVPNTSVTKTGPGNDSPAM